ncbi:hypothetical protein D3C86_1924320 [compost metagenome]
MHVGGFLLCARLTSQSFCPNTALALLRFLAVAFAIYHTLPQLQYLFPLAPQALRRSAFFFQSIDLDTACYI